MSNHFFPEQVYLCKEEIPEEKDVKKRPESAKGGFYGFGKNSKSAIATISKQEQAQKQAKLKEYRDLIGKQGGNDGSGLGGIGAMSSKSL